MSAIAWTVAKAAIQRWIRIGSGLAGDHVIWAGQNRKVPNGMFIEMRLSVLPRRGRDWHDRYDNPTPTAGAEVLQYTRGPREATLSVQCHAGLPTPGNDAVLVDMVLNDALSAHALESVTDGVSGLVAAGVGVGAIDGARAFELEVDGVLEIRAIAVAHLHLASELVETSTYIQTVNTTYEP